ncbi:hypothetical protein BGW39_011794 [Mortierella sp. 14UC]|nr:hypothetical protein BGW39_011794 [Mortierella sp. 14UC]
MSASTSIERKAITSSTTMNIMRRLATGVLTRSMVRTAVAARGDNTKPTPTKSKVNPTQAKVTSNPTPSKASISQGSTSTPAKDKASLLQLLMETAMMPGQLGQGSRDLLHVHRERLMAAGIEVPPEMAAILKDNDADKDHVPAPIDPRPYSVPVGLVSSTSAIHDMAQDRTRGPVRCSKKQERYQPYAVTHTGEGVSYVDGGEQSKLKGENGTLRESAYDPKTSMLLPNKRSASATPPQPSSLPLHRQAASLMGTTALATMAGGVGSNMTATGSPLGCSRDDILKQREAAMKKIVEFTMGLSLRAGPKD